jgi:hypothetical protein
MTAILAGRYADQPTLNLIEEPQVVAPVDIYAEATPLKLEVDQ